MAELPVGVVTDDPALEARLRLCLEFMGETVVQNEPEILVAGSSSDGTYPEIQSAGRPVIFVGRAEPPFCEERVGWLPEPLRLQQMQAVLHKAYACHRQLKAGSEAEATLFPSVIGDSGPIVRVIGLMAKVCAKDSTFMITVEPGTGKEVVARAIHDASSRCSGPFVALNCGAIPAELLEGLAIEFPNELVSVKDIPARFLSTATTMEKVPAAGLEVVPEPMSQRIAGCPQAERRRLDPRHKTLIAVSYTHLRAHETRR